MARLTLRPSLLAPAALGNHEPESRANHGRENERRNRIVLCVDLEQGDYSDEAKHEGRLLSVHLRISPTCRSTLPNSCAGPAPGEMHHRVSGEGWRVAGRASPGGGHRILAGDGAVAGSAPETDPAAHPRPAPRPY